MPVLHAYCTPADKLGDVAMGDGGIMMLPVPCVRHVVLGLHPASVRRDEHVSDNCELDIADSKLRQHKDATERASYSFVPGMRDESDAR
ncbi:hypothetical protein AURDEDRAFT_171029 [Auricularia subglabra TFB-10046 SS5]|nr:hypothetical protein AURDEDRAFT_171029 [Auricularia subglabra TFB-10046 SS5]